MHIFEQFARTAEATKWMKMFNKHIEKEGPEKAKIRYEEAKIRQNVEHGLSPFIFGENVLWALNQKNADRKAKQKGWIS